MNTPDFTIRIVDRASKPHARCFDDFAEALRDALWALGRGVSLEHEGRPWDGRSRLILFGLSDADPGFNVPRDAIVYNSEQVLSGRHWENVGRFKDNVFWDFSREHLAWFRSRGVERVVHCPIGYVESMERITPAPEDVDVLFYGWINESRRAVLSALKLAGYRALWLVGEYGAERDAFVARSKIVLNLHYYERPAHEMFRVSHLLANRKCVVSEAGGADAELEAFASRATRLAKRDEIVDACRSLLDERAAARAYGTTAAEARRRIADAGYEEFKKVSLVEAVRSALERS